ncbi:hypothetical protein CHISP_1543 [Chitinispirillum alkaliphilum]|nr:hypothetical protein CHISP_1543 [Chitinispirillum alkaliphilum]
MEGWLPDYALEEAARIFLEGDYKLLIVTGGTIDRGNYLSGFGTYAILGAATLKQMGVADSLIMPISAESADRDRTYTSALALREALSGADLDSGLGSFDLCAYDAHSRRSHLLFRRALGGNFSLGIISVGREDKNWWESSYGFRHVTGEAVAYIYALVRFW